MASLSNHQSATTAKMLYIGETGAGKTGSLASLVKAGYNLRILDFDNGLDVLVAKIKQECPDRLGSVDFKTCTDKFKSVGGKIIVDGVPQAWSKAINSLDNWDKLGSLSSWTPNEVLVVDSATLMSQCILRYVLQMNGRGVNPPQIQDWGAAMQLSEDLLAMLYSDSIKCNVIVTAHISYIEGNDGASRGYPSFLGNKLPPKVGRYFNTVIMAKTKGTGSLAKKIICTESQGLIELKTPVPGKLAAELPLETGMATIFEALRGKITA